MTAMGITILGTAGDSMVMGKQLRASGGILITTPQNQLHLDPGPGALVQLAKNNGHPRETTAILLSHQHVGHATDAAALISAMTHNGIDKRGILITNILDESMVPRYQQGLTEKNVVLAPGSRVGINDVEIKAVQAQHYASQGVGFLIQTPSYLIGYTGDTKYSDALAKEFKACDVLICNCKYPAGMREGDHLNVDDVITFLGQVQPQLCVLTHFGAKMVDSDPLAQARLVHRETNVHVIAAKDGLHIAPASYAIEQKQQKLSGF